MPFRVEAIDGHLCQMRLKMPVKSWNDWRRDEDGAAALEFAFLSIPFFTFLIGIIEIALMIANASVLEGATYDAARLVRTGQVQQGADPETVFRSALCGHAVILDCDAIQYNVTTMNSFSDAEEAVPTFDEDGNMEEEDFDAGGSGDIVMIRVSYLYEMMTPMLGDLFTNYPDRRRLMTSTVVLQTEPYEF